MPTTLFKQVSILFVDDDSMSRMLGKVILGQYNIKCVFASSGAEAIKRFKHGRFDIILLDINMPDKTGIEVAKQIRKIEKSNNTSTHSKIIALTANVLQKHIKEYLRVGMDDYILKPFNESNLIKKIAKHGAENKLNNAEPYKADRLLNNNKDYNLDELLKITKGDKEYTLLMLDTFIENGTGLLSKMRKSFINNDYRTIAEAAHRLLPSVEQLGFKNATSLLKRIETRYLKNSKYTEDPVMIEQALNEVESCVNKISLAKENYL